ncbi:myb-like protein D [Lates japonicus]|uniref:Myb-like protein D n=1 Tax=Lates japonicus TaxID=270547 RepID=A0AAD3MP72_LATJO|nr:myb-like protein D [Lates japonicus]
MDERGDGEHIGRNRPLIPLLFFPRGNRPPADQPNAAIVAWMEILLNFGIEEAGFAVIHDFLDGEDQENQDNNNNDNNENRDNDNNDNNGNNGNQLNDNNGNNENQLNDNNGNNENQLNDNNVNDDNNSNNENQGDNDTGHNADNSNENVEGASTSAGVEVDQGVEEDNPLPGGSRKRSRDDDEEDNDSNSSKQFRWWDEFADSCTDCSSEGYATDCDDNNTDSYTDWATTNSPIERAGADDEVAEDDPQPGPSRTRSREHDTEDKKRDKKSRRCYDFADDNSDTVTVATDRDLTDSRDSSDVAGNADAVTERSQEVNQQEEEEATQTRPCRKRPRGNNSDEDVGRSKDARC